MKVGILGSGTVAQTLAEGFMKHGHSVTLGTRDSSKLDQWASQNPSVKISDFAITAKYAEVVVLAVKGSAAGSALKMTGNDNLKGKIIIDVTNPIADSPAENGVLRFTTRPDESLMERNQKEFPYARFVKAFNSVGTKTMVNPAFKEGKPTMFICGNDDAAKRTVSGILEQFGWEVADMGRAEAARAIEPLCMLWCIPGLLHGDWNHAFKLLKAA